MQLNLSHLAAMIGIFQALFLSFFFVSNKKGDLSGNRLFAALLFVFAINIGFSFTQSVGAIDNFRRYYYILYVVNQVSFLISPLLYLYIKSLLTPNIKLRRRDLLHFVLFIGAETLLISQFFIESGLLKYFSTFSIILGIVLFIQDAFYIGLIIYILKKKKIKVKDLLAAGNSKIAWMRIFIVGFILVWNVKLQGFIVFNVEELWKFCPYTESLYFLLIFLLLNIIIFSALKNPELYSTVRKYQSSDLGENEKEEFLARLANSLSKDKLFLNPELSLPSLSEKLSIPVRYLSQIINEQYNKNFNDFINYYRIEESKRLLIEDKDGVKNILEIAYSVGFNSKSSFYDAFKKVTGITPKQFRAKRPG